MLFIKKFFPITLLLFIVLLVMGQGYRIGSNMNMNQSGYQIEDGGVPPATPVELDAPNSGLLAGRIRLPDLMSSSFLGQDDSGGSLDSSTITTSIQARVDIGNGGYGLHGYTRAFTNTGQYAIGQFVDVNPDYQYMLYAQFGHIPNFEPGLARPLQQGIRDLLLPHVALTTPASGSEPVVAFKSGSDTTAFWANYGTGTGDDYALNTALIDSQIALLADAIEGATYKPVGFMIDYFNNESAGYYEYETAQRDSTDLDQDGLNYERDANEQAVFQAAQEYFVAKLRSTFSSSMILTGNGKGSMSEDPGDMVAFIDGCYYEGYPDDTPFVVNNDPSEMMGYQLDQWLDNDYKAYSGKTTPFFFTDLRPVLTLSSNQALLGRAGALLFDGWWNYRTYDLTGTVDESELVDAVWDSFTTRLGTPIGPPSLTRIDEYHWFSRPFSLDTLWVQLDTTLTGISEFVGVGFEPPVIDLPPTLVSLTQLTSSVVELTFSEAVDATTANNSSNYSFSPARTLTFASRGGVGFEDTVVIGVTVDWDYDTLYTLTVNNVEDLAGNPIDPGSTIQFTSDPDPDPAPTILASAYVDTVTVTVTFSEAVDQTTAETTGNYSFSPSATVSSAVRGGGGNDVVTLTVASNLSYSTLYTITINNVEDTTGNPIATNSTTQFTSGAAPPGPSGPFALSPSRPIMVGYTYAPFDSGDLSSAEADTVASFLRYSMGMDAAANDSLMARGDEYLGTFRYESWSDDNTSGSTASWYAANYASYSGITDPEDFYLHYADSTRIVFGADTLSFSAGDRAVNYLGSPPGSRTVPAYHTDSIREARVDMFVSLVGATHGSSGYIGLYLDNASFETWNYVSIPLGGSIAEHPTNETFGTSAFNDWYFFGDGDVNNFGGAAHAMAMLDSAMTAEGYLLAANIGNLYPVSGSRDSYRAYVTENGPVADFVTQEFNPRFRFSSGAETTNWPRQVFEWNRDFSRGGVPMAFTAQPHPVTGPGAGAGAAVDQDELLRFWEFTMVYQLHPDSLLLMPNQYVNDVIGSAYGTFSDMSMWIGQQNAPSYNVDLGYPDATGPVTLTTGTDGQGQAYTVYSRTYDDGLAVFRAHYGSTLGATTAVNVDLGGNYYPLLSDGTWDSTSVITSISIENADGAILQRVGPAGVATVLEAPTLAGTTLNIPVAIPASLGSGPFAVTKPDGITELPVDGQWFLADSLYTGIQFQVYSDNSSNPNPVWPSDWKGVYHFEDDPTGGTLTDAGQSGNDFTLYRADRTGWNTDRRVAGVTGFAYEMDDADSLAIRTEDVQFSSDGTFSFTAWCSLATTSTDFLFQSNPGFWQFAAQAGGSNPRNQWKDFDRADTPDTNTTITWAPETGIGAGWHHIAFSMNSTTERIDVYLDGAKQNIWSVSPSGADTTALWDGYAIGGATDEVGIFGSFYWNPVSDAWDGYADYAAIIDRQLTPDEVNAIYVASADPEAWLQGDAVGPTLLDALALDTDVIQVFYDEALDSTVAQVPSNWSITGGLTINSAKVESQTSVVLTTSTPMTGDQGYTITGTGIEDLEGNPTTSGLGFVIRTENAGATSMTGSFSVFSPSQFNYAWDDTTSAGQTFARDNVDKHHIYIWDGDSYLDNEIDFIGANLATYSTTQLRVFLTDAFPNNTWYVVRVDPYAMISDTGDTTVTTQGPFSYQKGTPGIAGPSLGPD